MAKKKKTPKNEHITTDGISNGKVVFNDKDYGAITIDVCTPRAVASPPLDEVVDQSDENAPSSGKVESQLDNLKKDISEPGTIVTTPTIIDHLDAAINLLGPLVEVEASRTRGSSSDLFTAVSILKKQVIPFVENGLSVNK